MCKKLSLLCLILGIILSGSGAFAHEFDSTSLKYILSGSGSVADWTEFEKVMLENDTDGLFAEEITTSEGILSIALSLPQKKLLPIYAKKNPEFTIDNVKERVGEDAMLLELGVRNVFDFLKKITNGDIDTNSLENKNIVDTYEKIEPSSKNILEYIKFGWDHIIQGYDHLLFILALILALPGRRYLIRILTTFTVAHTITIIVGSFGLISIPSIRVESTIVISIALAALMSWNTKIQDTNRIPNYKEIGLVFFLGLVHGLGFSSFFIQASGISNEIVLPLVGFSVGVELGQFLMVCLFTILLHLLYKICKKQKHTAKRILIILLGIISLYLLGGMR